MTATPERIIRTRTIELGDHCTVVAENGDGPDTVVLLHGIGLDWRMWQPVINAFPSHIRSIAIDLRGYGAAATVLPGPLSQDVEDVISLIRILDLSHVHLVGLSYGGAVAQLVALREPTLLTSLGLVATTSKADAKEMRRRAAEAEAGRPHLNETLARWFSASELAEEGSQVRYARECLMALPPRQLAGGWLALAELEVSERLPAIALPTTVVAGELDQSAPPAVLRQIAERLPDATFHLLPGAAHMVASSRPAELAQLLSDGIRRATGIRGVNHTEIRSAEEVAALLPVPDLDSPTGLSTDDDPVRLRGGRCRACELAIVPAKPVCPGCAGIEIDTEVFGPGGTLYSFTTVHVSGTRETPYTIGYVDLAPDVRVLATIGGDARSHQPDIPGMLTRGEHGGWAFVPSAVLQA